MSFDGRDSPPRSGLTPPDFPSALAQPHLAAPAAIPAPAEQPDALPVRVRRQGVAGWIWVVAVLALALVALVAYFLTFLGPTASVIGMILALVPLGIVLFTVRLIDRWEPEPRRLVAAALGWGAIVAVALALLVDLALTVVFGSDDSLAAEVIAGVVQAPIVEETAKGLGVLLVFLLARRAFDGPVDGVVYGALVGAGFAFTENIQYFAVSLIEGGAAEAGTTFFLRGILSPFAHAMFTSVTGFALGLAARRGVGGGAALGPWLAGLVGAMLLHALWNGSATLGDFWQLYVVLQVPLFLAFVLGVLALRREEARLTRRRLGEYAAAGWFTAQEVDMLATGSGRRAALTWARTLRGDRTAVMRRFIAEATSLAAARQRALTGRDATAAEAESVLLARTVATRAALFTP